LIQLSKFKPSKTKIEKDPTQEEWTDIEQFFDRVELNQANKINIIEATRRRRRKRDKIGSHLMNTHSLGSHHSEDIWCAAMMSNNGLRHGQHDHNLQEQCKLKVQDILDYGGVLEINNLEISCV